MNYKIGIIGAGKIAHSLTPALIKGGFKVVSVSSSRLDSAWDLAKKNKIKNFSNSALSTVELADIIFLSVPDSQLEAAAKQISKIPGLKKKTFIHLSGTKNIEALKALKLKSGGLAGIHFLMAFPERKAFKIKGCYASVEASGNKTALIAKQIAEKLGAVTFKISGEDKILLHIMCVFAANFIQADYYNAMLLYKKIKSKLPPLEEILFPLSKTNLYNIKSAGIKESLSGPIARKDYDTVNEHLDKLFKMSKKENSFKQVLDSYAVQTLNLLLINRNNKGKR